ncbi:hypothetical protein FNF29_05424 [Cafeteria roenbergensis]|uniref:Uncharacterized protein n=1 Tax=Cafeteria roenbergensis TaxID=33653 RepID=A0A5A8CCA5_CAFRO|nr:hypothetical protein FNF29_05424 [Cafeteria roenbergensis]|eukprot:KAA0150184.1 hypothetical protein FNF29_05424 [Cafeteria roenbergensis]
MASCESCLKTLWAACAVLGVLIGLAILTGWPATLLSLIQLRTAVLDGLATAGSQQTAAEMMLESASITMTGIDFSFVAAWAFAPYVMSLIALGVVVFYARSKKRSIPRLAGLVLAAGFIVTSVTLSTMAFFRSQYSLRSVAITRFQGDGGFRELSSNVVIPTVSISELQQGAARISPAGLVEEVGTEAEVVGFVTWAYGINGAVTENIAPMPCGSGADAPAADRMTTSVCGVSAWVSTQGIALGQEDKQLAALGRMNVAVNRTVLELNKAMPQDAQFDVSATAKATVLTQIPELRGVMSARRADVAFANDVYVAYTVIWAGVYCLGLAVVALAAVMDARRSKAGGAAPLVGVKHKTNPSSTARPASGSTASETAPTAATAPSEPEAAAPAASASHERRDENEPAPDNAGEFML